MQAASATTGPFRAPRNEFQQAEGSIHNDQVASKLGFRGGTVPGSVHMDQFVPLLLDRHGERWFTDGGMSFHYTYATTDGEEVQASLSPEDARDRLFMVDREGHQVCIGTGNVGGTDNGSEFATRMAKQPDAAPGALRILAEAAVGARLTGIAMRVERDDLDKAMGRITERVPAYARGVLPPSHVIKLTHVVRGRVFTTAGTSVGLFGALEVQHLAGPLLAGVDYVGRTQVLKLTESPKAENIWYEVLVADPDGRDVARVLYMIRLMKNSSPLWRDEAA